MAATELAATGRLEVLWSLLLAQRRHWTESALSL
jgi:hypothetical protein